MCRCVVLCVCVCWSECSMYCKAFLGCIGQSGNVRIENFLGAHTLENVPGQSVWGNLCGASCLHTACTVCGERETALSRTCRHSSSSGEGRSGYEG